MEIIQTKSLQSDRIEYIIDKIIIPNLDMKISTNYYKLLEVMEKSGNDKLASMAHKLGKHVHIYECSIVIKYYLSIIILYCRKQ